MLSKSRLKHVFATHVVNSRSILGLTQQELAELAHTSLRRIQKIETATDLPSISLAVKLIILLGMDANAIIDELAQEQIEDEQMALPDNVIPFPVPNSTHHIQNKR